MSREAWNNRPGRSSKWISRTKRLAIYLRDGVACAYCGKDLRGVEPYEMGLDHLKPQSKGGTHEPRNLVTACRSCNSGRQDKPWTQYATQGARERINNLRRRKLNLTLARAIVRGEVDWADV